MNSILGVSKNFDTFLSGDGPFKKAHQPKKKKRKMKWLTLDATPNVWWGTINITLPPMDDKCPLTKLKYS